MDYVYIITDTVRGLPGPAVRRVQGPPPETTTLSLSQAAVIVRVGRLTQ